MEYRMYFFVPYNISDIQKGIQAGHCALEYAFMYGDTPEYRKFMAFSKTWVILNGGTTRYTEDESGKRGTLNEIVQELINNDIKFSVFEEPDLNNALSAICFLADERVWNKEQYPDWEAWEYSAQYNPFKDGYKEWIDLIGGEKNLFLRELLSNKHLA